MRFTAMYRKNGVWKVIIILLYYVEVGQIILTGGHYRPYDSSVLLYYLSSIILYKTNI